MITENSYLDDIADVTERDSAALYAAFFDTSITEREAQAARGLDFARVMGWWRAAVERVPAYRAFLAEAGIDPASVRDADDWARVPVVDKKNYISGYPLADLCWDGSLRRLHMIAVSSGSTGQPFAWPRGLAQELRVAYRFESVYRNSFRAHERSTLVVICFTLGTWVGGMFTFSASVALAHKGYPITVVTPGLNMSEIMRVMTTLAPNYEQVVLAGYPPFIKDVLEAGAAQGVDWARHKVKMVFAGEVFSEAWRDTVLARAGSTGTYTDTAALYGTADAGVLGNETPLSVMIRRFLSERPDAVRDLFGESRLPTLVQYDPTDRYFELVNGELVFSAPTGLPLLRYNIHDNGGLIPYAIMREKLAGYGLDPEAELRESGYAGDIPALPFVYVFGRSDFTISFYGANVYPENVKEGLEDPAVRDAVTGKFVMSVAHRADQSEYLLIRIELQPGVTESDALRETLAASIVRHLRRINAEFANYVPQGMATPVLELYPAGDPRYFAPGVKHRYTHKE